MNKFFFLFFYRSKQIETDLTAICLEYNVLGIAGFAI